METPYIIGGQVYLRPLHQADLEGPYLAWLNDPEVSRYLEVGLFPQSREQLDSFYEAVTASSSEVLLAIVDKESNVHIGNVKLGPINWVHRTATFGILIGDKQFWGRGIGTEVTRLAVEYAFYRINLRRVELGVYAEHEAAIRSYEKVGFKVEGRMRAALFHEGTYKDHVRMGLLRDGYEAENKHG